MQTGKFEEKLRVFAVLIARKCNIGIRNREARGKHVSAQCPKRERSNLAAPARHLAQLPTAPVVRCHARISQAARLMK